MTWYAQNTQRRLNTVIGSSIGSATIICEYPLPTLPILSRHPDVPRSHPRYHWIPLVRRESRFQHHRVRTPPPIRTVSDKKSRMYPHSRLIALCQAGIVVLVLFSYPLQLHPCRASLHKVLHSEPLEGAEERDSDEIPLVRYVDSARGMKGGC